jgi:hypothetical protein
MKLARHMISFSAEQNARHFRMRTFLEHEGKELTPQQVLLQKVLTDCYCETVACAVGHAPALFPALVKEFDKKHSIVVDVFTGNYNEEGDAIYRKEVERPSYRMLSEHLFGVSPSGPEFEFMFGGEWDSGRYHNYAATSWAVADRILYYLDNRIEDWEGRWTHWCHAEGASVRAGLISQHVLDKRMTELQEIEEGKGGAITSWEETLAKYDEPIEEEI